MLAAALCPCALGLNPDLDINQYAHNAWTIREGFFKGAVYAIAQTPDGYLWLGTEVGLQRFDGVRSVAWQPPKDQHLPGGRIRSLLAARDGQLWIGTDQGLASWNDGKLTQYQELAGRVVLSLLEDHEATIWAGAWGVGGADGRLCTIRDGRVQCHGNDGSLSNGIDGLYEDRSGKLWVGSVHGVWRWKPEPTKFFPMQIVTSSFAEGDGGELFITTLDGIKTFVNEQAGPYLVRAAGQQLQFGKLLRDRDGGLWAGTYDGGLLHVHQGKIDRFTHPDGLSSDNILCLFEDREGSIWVGTRDGLDRFREFAVPAITEKQGLSNTFVGSILQARDGSIWLGTANGLDRWNNGEVAVYGKRDGLPDASVLALFEDQAGRIWVSTRRGIVYLERGKFVRVRNVQSESAVCIVGDGAAGVWISDWRSLYHLHGQMLIEEIPWTKLGRKDLAWTILRDPVRGGLWLGFRQGGVAYYKDHSVRLSYGREQGFGEGLVSGLKLEEDGAIWAAAADGLHLLRSGHALRLSSANGLPCDMVHWVVEDDDHFFWLYTACGVVRVARSELERWAADPTRRVSTTIFDNAEGVLSSVAPTDSNPMVAKSVDGKIWFVTNEGVSVIDPHHLPFNNVLPPVHIEQIVADDKPYDLRPGIHLPAKVRDVRIDYTALSLVAPEKIRFKYKLEGQDGDWKEVINDREAKYTNLAPGNYRFRVMACNNSGVWNEEGASLDFVIPPAWYQTNWFRALLLAVFVTLIWLAHRLRVRELEEREKKFREAVESMPALAFVASSNGERTFVNSGWVQYTGLSVEQALGSGWQAAVHPDDLKRVLDKWQTAMSTGERLDYEVRLRRGSDGEYRWFHTRVVPLRDKRGKVLKWCGLATDIEDRKRAEELQADLAHTNRVSMLGELAASIAHEVNQPLSGIVSNASASLRWLGGDAPNMQEAREAARRIVRDGKRAGEIIQRLRSLYKKTPPKRELIDVNEIIGEMVVMLRGEANRFAVSIRADRAADLPKITADRVQLQQVLMNLMLNGIEAMNETGGVLTVKSQAEHGHLVISVSDTGVGLPAEKTERIFDAFFTTKPQGSGMGLAISRSIIESHSGRIWAAPNDGRGATFHFTLPTAVHVEEASTAGA